MDRSTHSTQLVRSRENVNSNLNLWEEELDVLFEHVTPPIEGIPAGNQTPTEPKDNTPTQSRPSGNQKKLTEQEKKAKRRAAVAAASRATRAKRKRELLELRETNKRLEKERERFLDTIAELQMKVQALRETGSIDLRMENDLLRAELAEHKQFIAQFKRIADGIPTSKTAKRVMCKQGANTAIAQVLGLASTSSIDTTWLKGSIKEYPKIQIRFQRLPYGVPASKAKRTSIRIDIPFVPVEASRVVEMIWKMWIDQQMLQRINRHFGKADISVREIDTGLNTDLMVDGPDGDLIKLHYYRESRPIKLLSDDPNAEVLPRVTMDTVQVCARKTCQVSASSFLLDEEEGTSHVKNEEERLSKRMKGISEDTQLALLNKNSSKTTGTISATVLACTSTQHGSELEPEKPGVHRIRSAVLEGSIVREVDGGCAWTCILSHPARDNELESGHLIIDDNGQLTKAWVNTVHEVHAIFMECSNQSELKQYAKAAGISSETIACWKKIQP